MTYDEFNSFCSALIATSYVVQWGGSHVWKVGGTDGGKVGGKVFAIGGWDEGEPAFTFKVSEIAYEILRDQAGLRPAPYFASRGMKWIQHYGAPGLSDDDLKDMFLQSYRLVSKGLSRKKRAELGLDEA